MKVYREDTSDLQLLIETLQIDPELISVDVIKNTKPHELSEQRNLSTSQQKDPENKDEKDETVDAQCNDIEGNSSTKDTSDSAIAEHTTNSDNDSTNARNENKDVKDTPDSSRKRKMSEEKPSEGDISNFQDSLEAKEAKISKPEDKDS